MPLNHSTAQACAPTTLKTLQRLAVEQPNVMVGVSALVSVLTTEGALTFLKNLLALTPSQIEVVEQIAAALSASDLVKLEKLMTQLPESCQSLLTDHLQQLKQKAGEVQA